MKDMINNNLLGRNAQADNLFIDEAVHFYTGIKGDMTFRRIMMTFERDAGFLLAMLIWPRPGMTEQQS
jgi:hypothetical protein